MNRAGWLLAIVLSVVCGGFSLWQVSRPSAALPERSPESEFEAPPQVEESPATEEPREEAAVAPAVREPRNAGVTPAQALEEVQALVNKGTIGAARALAERYLRELPDGPEAQRIESLTGVHPHP